MTKFDPQTLDPRSALRVKRYHTWPVIHQQSIGEHSIQVYRIIKAIWPEAPHYLLDHALTHDIGERVSGDIPYPVKANSPELKAQIDSLEYAAHLQMCIPWSFPPPVKALLPLEATVFKLAEYIEMWEYALDELILGNRGVRLIARRMEEAMLQKRHEVGELSQLIEEAAARYIKHRADFYELVTGEPVP